MILRDVIQSATKRLSAVSSSARLDAEVLLCHTLGLNRSGLIVRLKDELNANDLERFESLIQRRLNSEPIAYITGIKEFFGIEFHLRPGALIPRPETELMVERVLDLASARQGSDALKLLDLGTGSGCIALAIASELKKSQRAFSLLAVDQSTLALEIAQENAKHLGLNDCVSFKQSNWFSALEADQPSYQNAFDFVLSNPPYVDRAISGLQKDLSYEPDSALYAEESGLSDIKHLLLNAPRFMKTHAHFICEIGSEQKEALESFMEQNFHGANRWFESLQFINDLAGHVRMLELVHR